jgi:hypothetical protein
MPTGPAAGAKPAPRAVPESPAKPAPPPPNPSASLNGDDAGLSPARLRQIYGAYVDAKRQAHESTAAITYDKVASNLRDTAKQLRDKHQGRAVDFEVVMKNGKPVLKPVVKG